MPHAIFLQNLNSVVRPEEEERRGGDEDGGGGGGGRRNEDEGGGGGGGEEKYTHSLILTHTHTLTVLTHTKVLVNSDWLAPLINHLVEEERSGASGKACLCVEVVGQALDSLEILKEAQKECA